MNYISDIAHLGEKEREIVYERIKIMEFFDSYGAKETKRYFSKSRSTIFLWKQKLKKGGGRLSCLRPLCKAPQSIRQKRRAGPLIVDFILQYRFKHYGVAKETIKPALDVHCQTIGLESVSESTIGRIIKELKERGKLPKLTKLSYYARTGRLIARETRRYQKKLRRQGYQPQRAGDLIQIDAIEIFTDGLKRCIITALDLVSRFAFAYSYKTLSSFSAKDFMEKLRSLALFEIKRVQTDNGREFHKCFRDYLEEEKIIHFYNYPRHPQQNAQIENFNGVIQKQYIDWHYQDLKNPGQFNRGLMEYLLWYNSERSERPHQGIGKIPPLRYYVNWLTSQHNLTPQKSNMLWTGAST